jgi:hypothetical protein
MARTDEQVVDVLRDIYNAEFAGKNRQRFLVSWSDLRTIYGFGRLTNSRFESLAEAAIRRRLYLLDLGDGEHGHMIVVIRARTVNRWRRVPKRIIEEYRGPQDDTEPDEDDTD